MQEAQTKTKGKLSLKKQVVSNLSQEEMDHVKAGDEAFTTSFQSCTGWTCCENKTTETIWVSVIISIIIIL